MGTDIHYKFQKKTEDKWGDVELPVDGWGEYEAPYYIPRSYLLFSVLAGVRNGVGFAGCYRHEPITPISEPRGLPEGMDEGDNEDDWEFGEHTRSWLTGEEILKYFEDELKIQHQGIISISEYLDWDGVEAPEGFSGDVFGGATSVYDATVCKLPIEQAKDYTHVKIQWEVSVYKYLEYFKEMIELLQKDFGEVRMVFGFDS